MEKALIASILKWDETVCELREKWEKYNELKDDLAFGREAIDKDEIVKLLRDSCLAIRQFKNVLFYDENPIAAQIKSSNLTSQEKYFTSCCIIDYSALTAELALFGQDDYGYGDISENYIFSVWQVITRLLFMYAAHTYFFVPTDKNGVLCGYWQDCGIGRPVADEDDDFWEQLFSYNINTGDMSEILELVKRANKRF